MRRVLGRIPILVAKDAPEGNVEPPRYTCDACHRTLEYGWKDEDAKAEAKALFGEMKCPSIVCDDCFKKMMNPGVA